MPEIGELFAKLQQVRAKEVVGDKVMLDKYITHDDRLHEIRLK